MRVLLDECLPRRLRQHLGGHEITTVPEAGWAGRKNGELLRLAAGSFDVLLTIDASVEFQQNVSALPIAVIALSARSNRLEDLVPLAPQVLELLAQRPGPGTLARVSALAGPDSRPSS